MIDSRNRAELLSQSYFNNINVIQPNAIGQTEKIEISQFLKGVNNTVPIDNIVEIYILQKDYNALGTGSMPIRAFLNEDNNLTGTLNYKSDAYGFLPISGASIYNDKWIIKNKSLNSGFTMFLCSQITGSNMYAGTINLGLPSLTNTQGNNSINSFSFNAESQSNGSLRYINPWIGNSIGQVQFIASSYTGSTFNFNEYFTVGWTFNGSGNIIKTHINGLFVDSGSVSNKPTGDFRFEDNYRNFFLYGNESYYYLYGAPIHWNPYSTIVAIFNSGLSTSQINNLHNTYISTIGKKQILANTPYLVSTNEYIKRINNIQANTINESSSTDIYNFTQGLSAYAPESSLVEMYILQSGYTYTTTGSSPLKAFKREDNDIQCTAGSYEWTPTGFRPLSGVRLVNTGFFNRNNGSRNGWTVFQVLAITGTIAAGQDYNYPSWNNINQIYANDDFYSYLYNDGSKNTSYCSISNTSGIEYYPYQIGTDNHGSGPMAYVQVFNGSGKSLELYHNRTRLLSGTSSYVGGGGLELNGATGTFTLSNNVKDLYLYCSENYHYRAGKPSNYHPPTMLGMFFSTGLTSGQISGIYNLYKTTIGKNYNLP